METKFQTPWERKCQSAVSSTAGLGCGDELFDEIQMTPWKAEWQNMPEYNIEDLAPKYQIILNFSCAQDLEDFGKLIEQDIKAKNGRQMASFWFPEQEIGRMVNKRYIEK
jgi:hypothetical protein